jgi:hypothetical protein
MASVLIRWARPLVTLPGLAGLALLALQGPAERSMTAEWILASALSLQRVVPLLGLGIALALLSRRQCWAAFLLYLVGTAIGFEVRPWFMAALEGVPQAAEHLFLTGPLSNIAAGLLLIAPQWARSWLFAPVSVFVGAMLAVAISLTDPTVNELLIPSIGVAIGVWIVSAVALAASAIRHPWFLIAARIAGSWLLAAGLLYGGASLIPPPVAPLPPVAPQKSPQEEPFDGPRKGPPGIELNPGSPAKPADSHV